MRSAWRGGAGRRGGPAAREGVLRREIDGAGARAPCTGTGSSRASSVARSRAATASLLRASPQPRTMPGSRRQPAGAAPPARPRAARRSPAQPRPPAARVPLASTRYIGAWTEPAAATVGDSPDSMSKLIEPDLKFTFQVHRMSEHKRNGNERMKYKNPIA
ncbi:hypothetical protein BS78_03G027200 [Paspalum vaginatum]|nr:hypothetical protein BS78_03G027200 [Paspalum vaginatum]